MSKIPKNIIHFFHDKNKLPEQLKQTMTITRQNNSDFDLVYADDDFMYDFIHEKYNDDILTIYKLNQIPASRSDMARLMLLYEYGGFYLDVSMELQSSLNTITTHDAEIILVQRDDSPKYKNCPEKAHVINGIIGTIPNSEFIEWCIHRAIENLTTGKYNNKVWWATGPRILNDALEKYAEKYTIKKLSFTALQNEFVTYRRIAGFSNSWFQIQQKQGIIADLTSLKKTGRAR